MQPSTQVAHIPLKGLTLSGVRFFDNVAADLFNLVILILKRSSSVALFSARKCFQLQGIKTRIAQFTGLQEAPAGQLAYRAYVKAPAALAAELISGMEGHGHFAARATVEKSDSPGTHLLLAHAHT